MNIKGRKRLLFLTVLWLVLSILAYGCSLPPGSDEGTPTPTSDGFSLPANPTPTPTLIPGGAGPSKPEPGSNPCEGLSGELEVFVRVGPAEAVGLEPFAAGKIPFSTTTGEEPYIVQGGGPISYGDILAEEWGTYEVTLNMETTISGECVDGELVIVLGMTGDQMVEVTSPDFHGEYPWAGTVSLDLKFPLMDGASMEGEGWIIVLHLNSK